MSILKLKAGAIVISDGAASTEITLEAWREGARPEAGRFALVLPNDVNLRDVECAFSDFEEIILEFPAFKDGRAYSQARLLRERYGFAGEIRARGDVLRDQALFMARAGIDAFEVDEEHAAAFAEALAEFAHFYQPAADGAAPVWRQRAARAAREGAQLEIGRFRGRAA